MLRIKAPATSANLGSGFDCLGIALSLYNSFDVETAEKDCIENDDPRFCNPDNLFLKAWHRGCQKIGKDEGIHVIMHNEIPVSRGLGSSAAMIVGGLAAASALHNDALSDDEIFLEACAMEGHPDNAAPCFYGGLSASGVVDGHYVTHAMTLHSSWQFTVLIPDFEVSTAEARSILPETYSRKDSSAVASHAIWECEALRTGSLRLLKAGIQDTLHEPYRRQLIHDFDSLKSICEEEGTGVLVISGSGSTCLFISKVPLSKQQKEKISELSGNWIIRSLKPAGGAEIWGAQ